MPTNEEKKTPFFRHRVFSQFAYFWKREMYTILHDRGVILFFIIVPLFYPLLYGYIYNPELVYDANLVVVDEDQTAMSRELIRRIDGTSDVNVVGVVPQISMAREAIYRHDAYGYLVIPKGLSENFYTGKQTILDLASDLSSMLNYKAYMLGVNLAALELGRDMQLELKSGTEESSLITIQPAPNQETELFNPNVGYASFLIPIALILVLQQSMLLGTGMIAGTHREHNKLHRLVSEEDRRHARGVTRIIAGKSAAYLTVYIPMALWVLVFVPLIFDLPQLYFSWGAVLYIISFLLACTYFSLFLSCLVPDRESFIIYLVFTSIIFLFLTGIAWPVEAMPPFWRVFAKLIPSTPGAHAYVSQVSMGGDLHTIMPDLITLWIQTPVYFILSGIVYSHSFRKKA